MADPNSDVPDYIGPIPTLDELLMPEGSLGLEYEGLDDHPIGENIMINEDMNQYSHDHPIGENIMLNVDRNQVGHDHPFGENIMFNEDMNQFGHDHPIGENIRLNVDRNQFGHDHPIGENIMLNVDRNQFGHDHLIGKNIMLEENVDQFGHGTSQAGTSGVNNQSNAQIPGISDSENPIQLPEWPVPAKPYACSCCQVLRDIIHTIEGESRKFELHGRLGMISHGILEIRRGDMTAPNNEYRFFEESTHRVKMFLEQYCKKQKEAGYTLVIDPIWTFYQAVSVGFDWDLGFDINDFFQGSPIHIGEMEQPNVPPPQAHEMGQPNAPAPQAHEMGQPNVPQPQAQSNEVRSNTRTYREQRDRTKTLTIYDFSPYFHLPQNDAAKEVGVSSTVCKKICRDAGLKRWPFRQIKSLQNKIEVLSKTLDAATPAERARAEDDIQNFRRQIAKNYPPYTEL